MVPIDPSRRRFLKTSSFAYAALGLGGGALGSPDAPSWISRPMRWAQLTLVEDDPGQVRPSLLARLLPAHALGRGLPERRRLRRLLPDRGAVPPPQRWLGDRDPFGELVSGCRRLGMVVVARTDPHATYDDVQAAHPDWIAVDAYGKPRRHWASPEMWVTCGLGPYNFEFMTEVTKEIMARYRVDGIFINRWAGSGMCYCSHCAANFRAATGRELPRPDARGVHGPAGLPALAPAARLRPLAALGCGGPRDQPRRVRHPEHGRRRLEPPRHEDDRRARADAVRRPPGPQRADAALGQRQERQGVPRRDGPEARRRHLQRGRRGGVPLEGLGPERGRDPHLGRRRGRQRPAALVHQVRGRAPRRAGSASSRTSTAGTTRPSATCATSGRWPGSAWSTRSRRLVLRRRRPRRAGRGPRCSGGTRRSSRRASPSRWSTTGSSTPPTCRPLQTLILPNVAALSDEQCRQLREFVERGGGLVATYETSLYDECGGPRADFGLADLFGVSFARHVAAARCGTPTCASRRPRTGRRHPLLAGLEDAPRSSTAPGA